MNRFIILAIVLLTVAATSVQAVGTDQLNQIPLASVLPTGQVQVDYSYLHTNPGKTSSLDARVGLFGSAEIEGTHQLDNNKLDTLSGKVNLTEKNVQFAIGATDVNTLTHTPNIFGVAQVNLKKMGLVFGVQRVNTLVTTDEGFGGIFWDVTKTVRLQADYVAGAENNSSIGIQTEVKNLILNPYLLRANAPSHQLEAGVGVGLKF